MDINDKRSNVCVKHFLCIGLNFHYPLPVTTWEICISACCLVSCSEVYQSYLSPSLNKVHFCLLLLLPYVIFIFILMSMYRYLLRPWPTSSETNSIAIIEKCLKVLFGPLIPNINIHILLTILLIFVMLLVGRIG